MWVQHSTGNCVGAALLQGFGIDQVSKAGGDLLEESTSEVKYLLFLAFT